MHLEANPEEIVTEAVKSAASQDKGNMDSQQENGGQEPVHEDEEKMEKEHVQPADTPSALQNEPGEM